MNEKGLIYIGNLVSVAWRYLEHHYSFVHYIQYPTACLLFPNSSLVSIYFLGNVERDNVQQMLWPKKTPPGGTPYKGLYGEATPERGIFSGFRYIKG